MDPGNLVSIGKIVGTHGYKGTVKVIPLTDFPERFKNLQQVYLNRNGTVTQVAVESSNVNNQPFLIKLEGIESKEEAQTYRGSLLMVEEKDVFPLPAGVYYHFQLQGLKVYDSERGLLGTLTQILETGANDVYVVDSPRYGEILIPAIRDVIEAVDLDQGEMRVKLLPGLIDE